MTWKDIRIARRQDERRAPDCLPEHISCSRRQFLATAAEAAVAPAVLGAAADITRVQRNGPGWKYVPRIRAAFLERSGGGHQEQQLRRAAADMGIRIDVRREPLRSAADTATWMAEAKADRPDGLVLALSGAPNGAAQALDGAVPTIVLAPAGSACPTIAPSRGVLICADSGPRHGLKLLRAGAKLRHMRYLLIRGSEQVDCRVEHIGARVRYLPARRFLEELDRTPLSAGIAQAADDCLRGACRVAGPVVEQVREGIRSYAAARKILECEEGDGINIDCLGVFGRSGCNLPCLAWSRMLDEGIAATCESDLGVVVAQSLVQVLFERPGYQQEPVVGQSRDRLLGRHFPCPTRLRGFDSPPESYDLARHHTGRGIVPQTHWRIGQRVTGVGLSLNERAGAKPRMLICSGTVTESVPGQVRLDAEPDLATWSGIYPVFFSGDASHELVDFCTLFDIQAVLA